MSKKPSNKQSVPLVQFVPVSTCYILCDKADIPETIVGVVLNKIYGGFDLTDTAHARIIERDPMFGEFSLFAEAGHTHNEDFMQIRSNPALVTVIIEMGLSAVKMDVCSPVICYIPRRYAKYVTFTEYDGIESMHIDINKWIVDQIKQMCESDSTDKIREIQNIIALGEADIVQQCQHKIHH